MNSKILVMFFMIVALATAVSAVNLQVTSVQINGDDVTAANGHAINYEFQRGEKLDVDVCVQALTDIQDAQIEASIFGYQYSNQDTSNPVTDSTDSFGLSENDTRCQTLHLTVPDRIDMDYYKLRIMAADRDGILFENDYELHLTGTSRSSAVQIKDFTFNPETIVAGRGFTALVNVRNFGTNDLQDLKITVSIPSLSVQASEYMDQLDSDSSKSFEELLLRIPDCTKPGTYPVSMKVEFDDFYEQDASGQITVTQGDNCNAQGNVINNQGSNQGSTVVTVPSNEELSQGTSAVYPVLITNNYGVDKTYTLSLSGASDWATTKIDPSAVMIVPAGQSQTAYIYVSALDNAQLGGQTFTLTVTSDADTKQVPLTATITKSASSSSDIGSLKSVLEIGLVILVIVLIIIGLVIGFNKLKDNDKKESEPYY